MDGINQRIRKEKGRNRRKTAHFFQSQQPFKSLLIISNSENLTLNIDQCLMQESFSNYLYNYTQYLAKECSSAS